MIDYIPRPCYQLEKRQEIVDEQRKQALRSSTVLKNLPSHARALEEITTGVYSSNTFVQLENRCHPDTNANPQHAAQD